MSSVNKITKSNTISENPYSIRNLSSNPQRKSHTSHKRGMSFQGRFKQETTFSCFHKLPWGNLNRHAKKQSFYDKTEDKPGTSAYTKANTNDNSNSNPDSSDSNSCKSDRPVSMTRQKLDGVALMQCSKDFQGMKKKCHKLSIEPASLVQDGNLRMGTGRITYIHYFKGVGYIKLNDSGEYVCFHRIDFGCLWWLVTVAFALQTDLSFLYAALPKTEKETKELVLVDHTFLKNMKLVICEYGFNKSNYFNMLDSVQGLPSIMLKFKLMKKSRNTKGYKR